MKDKYSIEVERNNGYALARTLTKLADVIPDFEWDWVTTINAGGIDYGIYINVYPDRHEVVICNQPAYGTDGSDMIEDVLEALD